MNESIIAALIMAISGFLGSWIQRQVYKAQAKKSTAEAENLAETAEQAREKQFFDQVMAFSSVSSQKLLECEERKTKIEEKIRTHEEELIKCKRLKEELCEEKLKLLKKVREYEPEYQSDNPAE